ncbi:MAG: HAMP domain-containing sensor histidine kinase [Gemmataceae bacterium]|nr:HAMP domain-containing histidine kinase [Gemmata sp.]MDW8198019.1 HAMP domain-containing sensor histidine kinase [Gemmataceae bacterium]
MRLSLRYRLLIPLALLLLGDAVATAWAASHAARQAEYQLASQQWAVARTLTEPPFFPLTETILKKMQHLSGAEFLFTHPTLPPQSTFPHPTPLPPAEVPTAEHPRADEEPFLGPPVVVAGNKYRCLHLPLKPPHPQAGGNLYIFYPESLRQTAVADAVRPLLILGGAGGLVAVGLAYAIASQLVRRVRELDARTRLIAAGDFRPMPLPASDDELRDLCQAVNDMACQLAEFQQQLQQNERLKVLGQFSGGLAHQLRNAAAGAKLAIELFLTENPHADPEPLQVALRQLTRIETNVGQFLALGKPPASVREPCDLGQLIDQSVSLLKPPAQHLGTTIVWERPSQALVINGDPTALSHLFSNIIGNAVEAAGPGGTVTIVAHSTPTHIQIEVRDTGPGPPPAIAAQLFAPFVSGKDQGTGLGLAVAKQAADAHGGTIHWQRRNDQTIFTIQLPA